MAEDIQIDLTDRNGLLIYSNYNRKGILKDKPPDWEVVKNLSIENSGTVKGHSHSGKDESILVFCREQGYLGFKGNGWTLMIHIPTRIVFAPIAELRNKWFFILLPGITLVIIFTLILSFRLSKPLAKLRNAVSEVGKGKLDTRVKIESRDEIGELGNYFNQMVENLEKTTTSIDGLEREITNRMQVEEKLLRVQAELEARVAERTDALMDLRKASEELSDRADDLEKRNKEIILMGQMINLMQSCQLLDEAYTVFAQTIKQLFPNDSGALFVFRSSRNLLEAAAVWGKTQPEAMSFIPDDCWAMRLGRDHCVADVATVLKCRHVGDAVEAYLCVPMTAQGEMLGSLYLMRDYGDMTQSAKTWLEENQLLVHSITEQIGLALGNIKLRETLRHLAIHDPLTGLFNRRFMEESFDREFLRSKRKNSPIGIIILDIDHFKRLNDTFGHEAGGAVLRELGSLLQRCVRGSDIACRYGGEEFVIILPEASLEVTLERAEHIREQVKHLNVIHAGTPLETINISAGVAVFPDHGKTYEIILHAADIALYQAKKSGRDRVCVAGFDGDADSKV